MTCTPIAPGLEHLLWARGRWRHDVARIRSQVTPDLADSAFHGFADFFLLMGLRTKQSKAQGLQRSHVVQGVQVATRGTLAPTPTRLKKILGLRVGPSPGGEAELRQPDRLRQGGACGRRCCASSTGTTSPCSVHRPTGGSLCGLR